MADILAEKEKKKQEELERKKKAEEEDAKDRPLTEAERIALEEQRDLEIAKETFGVTNEASVSTSHSAESRSKLFVLETIQKFKTLLSILFKGVWSAPLTTEQDLKTFREALVEKLEKRKAPASTYVAFLEDLLRELCITLDTDDVKKLSATVNAVHNEKVNAAKLGSKAKKGKGKGAKLNVGAKNVQDDEKNAYYGTGYDEYDDFI